MVNPFGGLECLTTFVHRLSFAAAAAISPQEFPSVRGSESRSKTRKHELPWAPCSFRSIEWEAVEAGGSISRFAFNVR